MTMRRAGALNELRLVLLLAAQEALVALGLTQGGHLDEVLADRIVARIRIRACNWRRLGSLPWGLIFTF